ncbi:MAG: ATP-grasp domain-containing protein [Rhodoferax sp.]|uniref:ATP-grasp domain-containing protein n=1 Tax=Rhodoferax sp. TaxID=50421 RepID=UPI002612A63D|nr:ATP-grasp domain-containing protein [Rhodoferax sp.]MDD5335614.1 ATP-grasp domain-containing protein [Rhodoferax sp.]
MTKRRVLVFPAGTEIGLEIFQALKYCKEVELFGAGQNISNHARFAYPAYHVLPSIHENGWIDALIGLCQSLCIDYIFPAYDDVIVALSREADRLPARVITSSSTACEITRSKSATYRALSGVIRVPRLFSSSEAVDNFPLLVKPDRGQGSSGITRVDSEEELNRALQAACDPLICEYLPGEEYTVDCFSDREKGVLFAGARSRRRIRNGISVNTLTETLPEAKEMANIIGRELGLRGAWFFQLKRAQDGQLALLEVAPRIAGAMAAHRVSGVNFPLLSIFEEERLPMAVKPIDGMVELDRALGNRYRHSIKYSTLYLDLDDTLLVDGRVNTLAVKLLFQCINNGKKVVLLSRHRGDLNQTLTRHRLSGLFDEVIHLGETEKKSSQIKQGDAIFVDDSFAERMDVSECCNIPTFDCSMIELLTEQAEPLNGECE